MNSQVLNRPLQERNWQGKKMKGRIFLAVQWLGLWASTAEGTGSITGQELRARCVGSSQSPEAKNKALV